VSIRSFIKKGEAGAWLDRAEKWFPTQGAGNLCGSIDRVDKTTLPADRVLKVCRRFFKHQNRLWPILIGVLQQHYGQPIAENRL
jgi:hypothetical protein